MSSTAASAPAFSAEHARDCHRDGFVIARGLFSPAKISAHAAEAERVFARGDRKDSDNIRCRRSNQVETGECRLDYLDTFFR